MGIPITEIIRQRCAAGRLTEADVLLAADVVDLERYLAEPDTLPAQREQAIVLARRYRQQLEAGLLR